MTFLASLTTGAVVLVRAAAGEWQSEVAREVTIQVRPTAGRDIEADVAQGRRASRARSPGVADVRPYSKEESARLLEPWLGSGLALDDLPVPRLIVVRVAPAQPPDLAQLRKRARRAGPGREPRRSSRLRRPHARDGAQRRCSAARACSRWCSLATMLSVTFATRGAMATNRPVIEVLHLIGAKDSFIAGQFQRHFLLLGLKGGAIGGGARDRAVRARRARQSAGSPAAPAATQFAALFGTLLDRALGLCRGDRPGRPDRRGDRGDLALHRQPHARNDRTRQ